MSEEEEHMRPDLTPPKWVLWIVLVMIAISIGLASVDWR